MSLCEFCGYDVAGPCDSARLAARCQSLRSTCEFCGHDMHLPCGDAETAEHCRMQRIIRREERLSGLWAWPTLTNSPLPATRFHMTG